ncbi:MAG TPA: ABC transporter substrate-binding protein, partial [Candidatus Acidoferrales bacterium]|nr:ABC transporter substrate-binding protein [Candidatus Acidoferrales bacterium]
MSVHCFVVNLPNRHKPSQRAIRLSTLVALLLFAGCSGSTDMPSRASITVGLDSGPVTLDPRFATDAIGSQIGDLLFTALTTSDLHAQRRGWLASSWEMPDRLTYVFHLRQGFEFADGTPLTADDVKATFDSILDPRVASPKRSGFGSTLGVDALDPYTIRFRLAAPFPPFLEATGLGILSRRQLAAAGAKPIHEPDGAGPFHVKRFAPDDQIVLEPNRTYPDGAPRLSRVLFRVVPDATTRALELARGDVDLVQNGVEPGLLPWLRARSDLEVLVGPSSSCQYLGMNLRRGPLSDVRVRRAIAHAIDRPAIIDGVLQGLASPASGLLPPSHWAYNAHVATYDFDATSAERLLDEAGYPDPDGPGPRPRFTLSYKTTTVEIRKRIAEALQAQLARVGIGLDIRTYEWATFYSDVRHGNFDVYSLAWVG